MLSEAEGRVLGGVVVIVMVRRVKKTLMQVRERLKREPAERTRKRIAELLGEAEEDSEGEEQGEQGSEVEQLLRHSRQLLQQVEEERKGTVRVLEEDLLLLCRLPCCLHGGLFVQSVGGSCGAAAHK